MVRGSDEPRQQLLERHGHRRPRSSLLAQRRSRCGGHHRHVRRRTRAGSSQLLWSLLGYTGDGSRRTCINVASLSRGTSVGSSMPKRPCRRSLSMASPTATGSGRSSARCCPTCARGTQGACPCTARWSASCGPKDMRLQRCASRSSGTNSCVSFRSRCSAATSSMAARTDRPRPHPPRPHLRRLTATTGW